ncbi:hypothetical protein [Caulobacter sp. 17J65-9]|uniref:hypothetical protein n=1 Tax=Caulobacter sp. 17J65-9 TaxID=2709382 RepID=UPI0013D8C16B|nr:hypothetical protein [Caulobacter sp. 17J65-9]
MAITAALFVSNRLQKAAAAFLCLMAAHLVLASCTPEPAVGYGAVRVAVTR